MDSISVFIRRDEEFFFTRSEEEEKLSPINSELERGNTLRECVRKNVREDTGVEIEIEDKIERVEDSKNRRHWYLAEEVAASEENPNPDKINGEDGKWINLEEKEKLDEKTQEFIEEHREELLE